MYFFFIKKKIRLHVNKIDQAKFKLNFLGVMLYIFNIFLVNTFSIYFQPRNCID